MTPLLQFMAEDRGSEPATLSLKADALPNELLPLQGDLIHRVLRPAFFENPLHPQKLNPEFDGGKEFEPPKLAGFTVRPIWPL